MNRNDAQAVAADYERFKDLTFESFRQLAQSEGLTCYQQIGFPDSYRQGHEEAIFRDICRKLPQLGETQKVVLDIGPGCSELPRFLIDKCRQQHHELILCDSAEMLAHLPDSPKVRKIPGYYPTDTHAVFDDYCSRVDALVCYSVLHYVFVEQPLFEFLDRTMSLLAPGGSCLLGDIPNVSKRKRFFSSEAGIRCHQDFTGHPEVPEVTFNCLEPGKIDDAVVLAILSRCRAAGFDAYVLPQPAELPIATRREDILIHRP